MERVRNGAAGNVTRFSELVDQSQALFEDLVSLFVRGFQDQVQEALYNYLRDLGFKRDEAVFILNDAEILADYFET